MEIKFGDYLKKLRKNKGLTLKQLGEITGFSHTYLSQLERGLRGTNGVPSETLKQLSRALEIDYAELLIKAGHISQEELNRAWIQEDFHIDDSLVFNRALLNKQSPHIDLKELLENTNSLAYNGWDLIDSEREQILNMLAVLFPTRNKEKRDPK